MEKPDLSKLSPEMQDYIKSLEAENLAKDAAVNSLAEQVKAGATAEPGLLKIKKGKETYIMKYSAIRHNDAIVKHEDLLKDEKLFAEILAKNCGSFELVK